MKTENISAPSACSNQDRRRNSQTADKTSSVRLVAWTPLTGVLNHSMIQAHLKEHLNLYALYPVPFSVMCYGVDDLSKLGERYGRQP